MKQTALLAAAILVLAFTTTLRVSSAHSEGLTLLSPADGARFAQGDPIVLTAGAPYLQGPTTRVEFFADQQSLGLITEAPFTLVWTGAAPGEYSLTARASVGRGTTAISASVSIEVSGRPEPVGGAAALCSFVIDSTRDAQGWGNNEFGQLGTGALLGHVPSPQPVLLPTGTGTKGWRSIAAGRDFALFLGTDGQLYACGLNQFGALGLGAVDLDVHAVPAPVPRPPGVNHWRAVAAGSYHCIAIDDHGDVYAWGSNFYGELGRGDAGSEPGLTPQRVQLPSDLQWVAIAAGYAHTLALSADGQIYSWGFGDSGQLGRGSFENDATPSVVRPPPEVKRWLAIAAGYQRSLALGDNGRIYSWGNNSFGQLGNGTFDAANPATNARPAPVLMPPGVDGWTSVISGAEHSFAFARNGGLYSWGRNDRGQLTDGTPTTSSPWGVAFPKAVPIPAGVERWLAAAAGNGHTLLVGDDCRLYTGGLNEFGELGNGELTDEGPFAPLPLVICR